MTDTPFAPRFDVDWSQLDDDAFQAVILAYRMASDRERGHADCPRRACRGAGRCLGRPRAKGDPPCQSALTPFAWGHAKDHWLYAQKLLDMARGRRDE